MHCSTSLSLKCAPLLLTPPTGMICTQTCRDSKLYEHIVGGRIKNRGHVRVP